MEIANTMYKYMNLREEILEYFDRYQELNIDGLYALAELCKDYVMLEFEMHEVYRLTHNGESSPNTRRRAHIWWAVATHQTRMNRETKIFEIAKRFGELTPSDHAELRTARRELKHCMRELGYLSVVNMTCTKPCSEAKQRLFERVPFGNRHTARQVDEENSNSRAPVVRREKRPLDDEDEDDDESIVGTDSDDEEGNGGGSSSIWDADLPSGNQLIVKKSPQKKKKRRRKITWTGSGMGVVRELDEESDE